MAPRATRAGAAWGNLSCGPGTVEMDGQCVAETPLEPGSFQAPLVQLQRLQGTESHMHVAQVKYRASDSKLFYCSYTFGVIDAADPQSMRYRVQGLRHQTPSGSPRAGLPPPGGGTRTT